jgi:hypothetical protein
LGYDKSKHEILGASGQQWRKAKSRRRCAVPWKNSWRFGARPDGYLVKPIGKWWLMMVSSWLMINSDG